MRNNATRKSESFDKRTRVTGGEQLLRDECHRRLSIGADLIDVTATAGAESHRSPALVPHVPTERTRHPRSPAGRTRTRRALRRSAGH